MSATPRKTLTVTTPSKTVVATCEPPSGTVESGIVTAMSSNIDQAFAELAQKGEKEGFSGVYSVRVAVQMNGMFVTYGTGVKPKAR